VKEEPADDDDGEVKEVNPEAEAGELAPEAAAEADSARDERSMFNAFNSFMQRNLLPPIIKDYVEYHI